MFFSEKFEQAPRDNGRQRSLASCSPWGHKESDKTQLLYSIRNYILFMNILFKIYIPNYS